MQLHDGVVGGVLMREFRRQYDKAWPHFLEPGGGEQLVAVDQQYETVEHLVGRMLEAGERLEAARASGFQFPDGVDTGEGDVTRSPGFDLADLSREAEGVNARLSAQEEAARKKVREAEGDLADLDRDALVARVRELQAGAAAAPEPVGKQA